MRPDGTETRSSAQPVKDLPGALDGHDLSADLRRELSGREPAWFLDYDGTLAEIVDDPAKAGMRPDLRSSLDQLNRDFSLAIVSGRDRLDVARLLGGLDLVIAGSHGFDIAGPGLEHHHDTGAGYDALMADVRAKVEGGLGDIPGIGFEYKRSSVAVHFRTVQSSDQDDVVRFMDGLVAGDDRLKMTPGKMVREVMPKLDWHKGRAVLWLIEAMGLDLSHHVPIYIGDDITDEDGFAALEDRGIGIIVAGPDTTRLSKASFRLDDVESVGRFLAAFVGQSPRGS
ncbi:MAG: trehalose-phosphatase [Magnetovibrionaceae bacterium]